LDSRRICGSYRPKSAKIHCAGVLDTGIRSRLYCKSQEGGLEGLSGFRSSKFTSRSDHGEWQGSEANIPASDNAGMPTSDHAGMPAADHAGMPAADHADMPASDHADMPASDPADMPASDHAGFLSASSVILQ
jgi:hypothetical protein